MLLPGNLACTGGRAKLRGRKRYLTNMHVFLPAILICMTFSLCEGQVNQYQVIDLSKFSDGIHHWDLYSPIRSLARLDSADIIGIADNLLAYQNTDGGWPKNIDWLAVINPDSVINALSDHYRSSTFDNRNTFPQIEYLSAVYRQTGMDKYRVSAERGFQYLLNTEYPKGGWRGWDADVITFNDDVMTGIMQLLLDVKQMDEKYAWLTPAMRAALFAAYTRGIDVILKCQIVLHGRKTAWCQQHDFNTYAPAQGRTYEHPSITANESADVVLFLMRIADPDQSIIDAVNAAVEWLESAKITGYRYGKVQIPARPYHETMIDYDFEFVPDPDARPVWARYYDLETGSPFLSLRDGTIVYDLAEISFDRRIGYAWYGFWPQRVFARYAEWTQQH